MLQQPFGRALKPSECLCRNAACAANCYHYIHIPNTGKGPFILNKPNDNKNATFLAFMDQTELHDSIGVTLKFILFPALAVQLVSSSLLIHILQFCPKNKVHTKSTSKDCNLYSDITSIFFMPQKM